jgi:proteasome lid subunit RPN8/RPN11
VLRIGKPIYDSVVAHARRDHPDEACGIVAGAEGSDEPTRFVPMTNAERSPTFFRFDSMEQLKVWRELDERGEVPVVIYHSHTATAAYPSRTDVGLAAEPDAHYALVSTAACGNGDGPVEFRSFRIVDGVVTEEDVEILP